MLWLIRELVWLFRDICTLASCVNVSVYWDLWMWEFKRELWWPIWGDLVALLWGNGIAR